jgi:ribosome-associated heat shock protein Hsp15
MGEDVRLDVWLDVACLAKTRSQAKELCDGGRVEVNGARAKSHRAVRVGDRVHITVSPFLRREVVVREVLGSNVARVRARELYEDVTPPPTPEEVELRRMARLAPPPAPPRGAGRPEKRARRQIDRVRGR